MKVKLGVSRALSPVFETGNVDLSVLLPVLEQHAAAMVDDARENWPVDTGISRDAWDADVAATETTLMISLSNDAQQRGRTYAAYVHRARSRRLVYTEVQERLTLNLIPELQADIAVALAENLKGA